MIIKLLLFLIVQSHDYTLFPTNARAHIKRNTSEKPLKSASMPRVNIDIIIEEVAVSLSNVQYKLLVYWTRELDKQDRLYRCLKWRPDVSVKERSVVYIHAQLYYNTFQSFF